MEDGLDAQWDESRITALVSSIVDRELPTSSDWALSVHLVGDDTIRALNHEHRGIDSPTDVLSFPLIDSPADVLSFPLIDSPADVLSSPQIDMPADALSSPLLDSSAEVLSSPQIDMPADVLHVPRSDAPRARPEVCRTGAMAREEFALPPGEAVHLGDIVISYPRAVEQAHEYGHSVDREVAYLTAHGVLHVLGHDHEEESERRVMRQKEEEALAPLGFTR